MIVVAPQSQTLVIGQQMNFSCEASSDPSTPVIYYSWLFNLLSISYSNEIYQDGSSLVIVSASEDNLGTYTCVATNGYSSASAGAQLLADINDYSESK